MLPCPDIALDPSFWPNIRFKKNSKPQPDRKPDASPRRDRPQRTRRERRHKGHPPFPLPEFRIDEGPVHKTVPAVIAFAANSNPPQRLAACTPQGPVPAVFLPPAAASAIVLAARNHKPAPAHPAECAKPSAENRTAAASSGRVCILIVLASSTAALAYKNANAQNRAQSRKS
ncbi:hypothetical protein K7J14_07095 [Treponema zuelzerae]|uniref:Uncharacterized protein n=1 Tax=Teretinema zuelzerae TaxID=156 RepID=A0AAE3EGF6_9SPIR|nr:hypothetical protein [Teretinema zuelzerae]MCD1654470.1 hypothetical protein [Teretinema zuelzerae]